MHKLCCRRGVMCKLCSRRGVMCKLCRREVKGMRFGSNQWDGCEQAGCVFCLGGRCCVY